MKAKTRNQLKKIKNSLGTTDGYEDSKVFIKELKEDGWTEEHAEEAVLAMYEPWLSGKSPYYSTAQVRINFNRLSYDKWKKRNGKEHPFATDEEPESEEPEEKDEFQSEQCPMIESIRFIYNNIENDFCKKSSCPSPGTWAWLNHIQTDESGKAKQLFYRDAVRLLVQEEEFEEKTDIEAERRKINDKMDPVFAELKKESERLKNS